MLANSSSSNDLLSYYCSTSKLRASISTAVSVAKTLLVVPLCTFILYLGLQRWRQQRSSSSASSSDLFTYHLAAMELISIFGFFLFYIGEHVLSFGFLEAGICLSTIGFYGEMSFLVLTCVEWHLAVVHPITYLRLKNTSGLRISNICIGGVWLLCFALMGLYVRVNLEHATIAVLCCLVVSIVVTSVCSFSALWVLVHPGPGEGGKVKDQSKQRAFHTITAIFSVLWLWFFGLLVATALECSSLLDEGSVCVLSAAVGCFDLPACLVLPLLFLHRAGRMPCGFNTRE